MSDPLHTPPGHEADMPSRPDHGEHSYVGHGRLAGKTALITGADSGIGKAVAIAFAREGCDVVISYLNEHDDAKDTAQWIEQAGRKAVLAPGDLRDPAHCRELVATTVRELGHIDILVSNAAHQATFERIEDISDEEWKVSMETNIDALFHLTKAAAAHMRPGASIIATTSVSSDMPDVRFLPYTTTKAAIANYASALAQMLAPRGIRVNSFAPGSVWTPFITSTLPADDLDAFGKDAPAGRPAQPAELAPAYVLLASDEASYISASRLAVTGGIPVL